MTSEDFGEFIKRADEVVAELGQPPWPGPPYDALCVGVVAMVHYHLVSPEQRKRMYRDALHTLDWEERR